MPPAPTALDGLRLPREVIFVIDNSGSMHGASIDQARAALRLALGRLRPTDSFNVIRFNHTRTPSFRRRWPRRRRISRWPTGTSRRLRAEGGTEMLPALRQALDGQEHPGRLRQVIFLTDGAVGNEAQLFAAIHERLGDSRLFTIGIGSAPNSHFMREAARLGRGTFTYIGSTAEVKDRMVALFAQARVAGADRRPPRARRRRGRRDRAGTDPRRLSRRARHRRAASRDAAAARRPSRPLGLDRWERELSLQRREARTRACPRTGRAERSPRCSTSAGQARPTTRSAPPWSSSRSRTTW